MTVEFEVSVLAKTGVWGPQYSELTDTIAPKQRSI